MLNRPFLLILMTSALLGCNEPEEPAQIEPRVVLTAMVHETPNSQVRRFAGELQAADRALLSFESSGTVTTLHVDLGARFKKGDTLARINPTQAKLNLEARKAELADLRANQHDAKREYKRLKTLLKRGAVSIAAVDQAKTRAERADALFIASQAAVETAEKQLGDTYLKAPFNGEVVARLVEPSQVVGAGQGILEVVGRNGILEGVVTVSDTTRASLKLGSEVDLILLASTIKVTAKVTEIGNRANSAGLFPVTIILTPAPGNARSGQAFEAVFHPEGNQDSLSIPLTAYTRDATGNTFAYTLAPDRQTVHRRKIELGALRERSVPVLDGLDGHEEIVIKGVDLLNDGQTITPMRQQTAAQHFGS